MKKLIIILMVGSILSQSRNATLTSKGNIIEYMFGSFKPSQDICLTKEKRKEIQYQLNENIIHLNLDQKLFRADNHVVFSWPLLLNDNSNDYGYHGVSGFVDNNLNYNDNLLDYNCGSRTYDTEDYNHQGTDYYLWPFEWNKVDDNAVSVIAVSSGIIIGKRDGNYDRNCGGWDTDYSTEWNAVYIQNDDGSISWYGHMKNGSLTNKSLGDTVNIGEYLGIVASSGISTGPHLHFETYKDNTYNQLIDPYYGECNNYNDDTWWIEQRPYYDSAINKIMTHSAPPEFYWDECAKLENINAENNFTPNNYIYFGAYYRDQLANQSSQWSLIDPAGNIYDEWEQTVQDFDHYSSSYWWYSYLLNNTVIKGEWTFQIIYNEKQYEHKFLICNNSSIPDNACDCDGNIEDECGVCGGDGIEEACECKNTSALNENGCCDDIEDLGCGCGENDFCLSINEALIPDTYVISSIYPNPFNPTTTISFSIPEFGLTTITLYDMAGRKLETLTNKVLSIGNYSINWNASSYPNGVYLVRMESGEFTQTQKMVLVK